MSYYSEEWKKVLYEEGDEIDFHFQTYPGPNDHIVKAKIIKCLSPTFYEIEYKFWGKTSRIQLIRSHLP